MLLILAAGGTVVAAAARWLRKHPGRIEEELVAIYREAYLEVRDESTRGEEAKPSPLTALDTRYQRFVVEKVDPLLSRTRRDQLAEITTGEVVAITDDERWLNRHIGIALVGMGTAAVGIVYPAVLVVTFGAALFCVSRLFRRAYNSLSHGKLDLAVLGSFWVIGAFAGGFFLAGTFGMVVWFLSEKLVLITQDRSQNILVTVFGEQPRTVWIVVGNVEVEVPIETIQTGDTAVIQAGQVIPVDGVIISGIATVDQHALTGESQPVEKGEGDRVLTSTLMVGGKVYVCVEKTGEETLVAQIGTMLNKTASYQATIISRGQLVADKSVPPTIALALIAFPFTGYRSAVAILGSSIGMNIQITGPISMLNFLNVAANHGILVKDGRSLELLTGVDLVVFDKTGTLTMEQPRIARIHTCADLDADTVLLYAAAAEHRQTHPIARAILDSARDRGLTLPSVDSAHYEIGFGIRVRLEDRLIRVGSRRYMDLEDIHVPCSIKELVEAVQERGNALVMVAVDEELVGAIELQPMLRTEVLAVVRFLRSRNLDLCIISGDQEEPTRRMAEELGITRYFANTLPEQKAGLVAKLQSEGHSVCFVGDGINDSISLKRANVSVSLRGASTAATDSAQIVLMGQGLGQLPFVFELADEFDTNMRAGFDVAVGQGIVVIGGALLGIVGIVGGTLIWTAGLAAGLGIAHIPLWRHRAAGQKPAVILPPSARAEIGPGPGADVQPPLATPPGGTEADGDRQSGRSGDAP
jgi:Cu2+-exporting ATPase